VLDIAFHGAGIKQARRLEVFALCLLQAFKQILEIPGKENRAAGTDFSNALLRIHIGMIYRKITRTQGLKP
jgi:hypothetical protein